MDSINTTTSANLSETKTIIFLSICLPLFQRPRGRKPQLGLARHRRGDEVEPGRKFGGGGRTESIGLLGKGACPVVC